MDGLAYVYPEYAFVPPPPRIEGHWERDGAAPLHGPGWDDAVEAIAWGRERAPEVYLRIDTRVHSYRYARAGDLLVRLEVPSQTQSTVYVAGADRSALDEPADGVMRAWPPGLPTQGSQESRYGGSVFLTWPATKLEFGADLGYGVRWERVDGKAPAVGLAGPAWKEDLVGAVEWARARARYVVVTSGPPDFAYWSAGEVDVPELGLPSWPHLIVGSARRLAGEQDAAYVRSQDPRAGKTFSLDGASLDELGA